MTTRGCHPYSCIGCYVPNCAAHISYNLSGRLEYVSIVLELPSPGDVCANHMCDMNAECIPKGGDYTCTCKQGYEGSGWECKGRFL